MPRPNSPRQKLPRHDSSFLPASVQAWQGADKGVARTMNAETARTEACLLHSAGELPRCSWHVGAVPRYSGNRPEGHGTIPDWHSRGLLGAGRGFLPVERQRHQANRVADGLVHRSHGRAGVSIQAAGSASAGRQAILRGAGIVRSLRQRAGLRADLHRSPGREDWSATASMWSTWPLPGTTFSNRSPCSRRTPRRPRRSPRR